MASKSPAVIFHNPKCSTSGQVLAAIKAAGRKPTIIEYLKTGWTEALLLSLFAAADLSPRQALRAKAKEAEGLGLLGAKAGDAKIVAAMLQHPVLVERPFVVTPKGVRLCRPKEIVQDLL